jgi:hypothetical protein
MKYILMTVEVAKAWIPCWHPGSNPSFTADNARLIAMDLSQGS